MVMDANFVITWKPILACWACSHRGKNGLTDQKIEIFKVHDIDTTRRLRRGPVGPLSGSSCKFWQNLTMLVEKFWNASTGRLNRVNAAIDASNFYFNMLEIFQMYFTFPSFKNIATQRSFNENIHFPLHCLKSTFSFQKSCRKSEKMILGRSFQLSSN